jgi:heterodisulfide reductase subunit A
MTKVDAMTADENSKAVLVVGAGIAGMAAGMHLAQLGHPVYLLDAAPTIGGSMHLLDHTFPTNSCGICLMLPHQPAFCPTFECDRQPNITLLPYAEVVGLSGHVHPEPVLGNAEGPGAFIATVRHKARYVDVDACTGCADCAAVCPEARPHDHEGWLAPVKAIFRPPGLRAVPDAWVIDMETCTRCGACVEACPTAAIDLDMQPRLETLQVGAVLLTPGFAPFDARLKGEYGYRVYDNVLSALEFERMASLAGSSIAHLARPSDGKPPQRLAFVHCVGSRDNLCGAGHCSSTCCMFTAKQVALAKKLDPELDVTVFHMDLRAFGKDFEAYIEGVQALPGVTYRRAMPSSVHQLQQTKDLLLTYAGEDGKLREEAFDLLVLAVGFAPPPGMRDLARELGIPLNDYGFALTGGYHPTRAGRPGLFVAGAFREPKDIPETVAEAAGAAAEVAAFLQGSGELGSWDSRGSGATAHTSRDVSDEEPRIGVFVCECNGDPPSPSGQGLSAIGVPDIVRWAETLPGVALSQPVPDGCLPQGRAAIQAAIEAEGLNRVVVAGCSPRLFADEFEALMHGAGLDPRLLARVNLREQVLYPHRHNGAGLTQKAQSLVGMAVAGLKTMAGVEALALGASQTLTRRAVVVGGGAAGMTAALQLARLHIPVDLVEREPELGGQWRHIRYQADASNPQAALAELIAGVQAEERIQVHLAAELTEMEGGPGHYASVIVQDGQEETVDHGVLVVATGGRPAATPEYLYGQPFDPAQGLHARVVTQRELEQQLANPNPQSPISDLQTVVMIQCVGSREPERPYCSRVCCTQAVKNALKLKELKPEANVYVLYREVRTYGFREAAYQAARDAGVVFVRYELPDKPQVQAAGDQLRVALTEPVTGQPVELDADLLVLSVGIDPEEEHTLAETLGVDLNGDGFFQEEHPKMKPLDLSRCGIYVAGLAHSPRFLEETIAQAQGAAMRAAAFLAPREVSERPTSVWVNARLCSFCGLCVEACPFEARVMNYDTRVADVDYTLCQGCGVCAMVCPNKATLQKAFEHKQLMAAVDMALV